MSIGLGWNLTTLSSHHGTIYTLLSASSRCCVQSTAHDTAHLYVKIIYGFMKNAEIFSCLDMAEINIQLSRPLCLIAAKWGCYPASRSPCVCLVYKMWYHYCMSVYVTVLEYLRPSRLLEYV